MATPDERHLYRRRCTPGSWEERRLADRRTNADKLGEHLDHAVRTGTYCAYVPGPTASTPWTS